MPSRNFGTSPNFIIKDKAERKVNVIREPKNPHIILLMGRVIMTPPPNRTLSGVEWRKLAGKISIEMARLGIEFDFTGGPNPYEIIVLLDPVIIDDSLSNFFFRQRIFFVIRAMILVIEIYRQYLAEPEPQP